MDNPDYPELLRTMTARGKPLPPNKIPPEVLPGYQSWVVAFHELGTERQLGYGCHGPIPRSAIIAYTEGWPESEARFFYRVMRDLDLINLSHGRPLDETTLVIDEDKPISTNPARDAFRASMVTEETTGV